MYSKTIILKLKTVFQGFKDGYPVNKYLSTGERPKGWLGLKCNGMLFEFQVVRMNANEVRAYLLSHPKYGDRSQGLFDTHRHQDGKRYYVCPGTTPKTGEEAKEFAKYWCIYTEHYIRTGEALI